jgi:hypothetical protein
MNKKSYSKYVAIGHNAPIKPISQILREIDPEEVYRPIDIVRNGWIRNTLGFPDYNFLLAEIRKGKLPAKRINNGSKNKPRYVVKGENLLLYLTRKFLD